MGMATSTRVNVTEPLIDRATQRDSRHCMIAEAIQHAHPEFKNIMVDLATIRWTNPRTKKRYVCLTPEVAARALVEFDQGRAVEPFAFTCTPIQSTPVKQYVKDENGTWREKTSRGRKQLRPDGTISGGKPIKRGHLQGGADVRDANAAAKREKAVAEVTGGESNTKLSGTRYRQYGRRILSA
jgi:hypothetical protein